MTVSTDRTAHRVLDAAGQLVVEIADDQVDAIAPGQRAATLSIGGRSRPSSTPPAPTTPSPSSRPAYPSAGTKAYPATSIVGFPGHLAIYLGDIDGTPYILEASWVGTPIHIVPLTRSDHDPQLHRYWT
jgi:hypothetical protein